MFLIITEGIVGSVGVTVPNRPLYSCEDLNGIVRALHCGVFLGGDYDKSRKATSVSDFGTATSTYNFYWCVHSQELLVFVTSFATGEQGAIHSYRLNPITGQLIFIQGTKSVENPFFIVVSPDEKFLYSIHAPGAFGGGDSEQVAAYQLVARTGQLKLLNRQSARGSAACYLDVDATGKTVAVANYSTGSVATFPVNSDGSLSEAASFFQHTATLGRTPKPPQDQARAHCIVFSPDNRFAFAADLGLDQIFCYRLDAVTGKLTPNQQPFVRTPREAGPRRSQNSIMTPSPEC